MYYPHRPLDVLLGFLFFAGGAGLVALLIYGILSSHAGGAVWLLIKIVPFALAGLGTMLYRETVITDQRTKTIEVRQAFFLIPLGRTVHRFSDVVAVEWRCAAQGPELVLTMQGGQHVLERADAPKPEQAEELRRYLGLND